jgi:hypothetical protein
MLIQDYRWEHRQLPEDLAKLNRPDAVADPFGGGEFQYESRGGSLYRLYSKGNRLTGEIELNYRRPASIGNTSDAPPSFLRQTR